MSALLGRIPSAVGYQPTLATDMGSMQERITTTKKGSITSVQVSCGLHICSMKIALGALELDSFDQSFGNLCTVAAGVLNNVI